MSVTRLVPNVVSGRGDERGAARPASVVDVAPSISTATSSPGAASPAKLTVVFRRVRPRSRAGSVRLGALDEHLLDPADPLRVPLRRDPLDDVDQPLEPLPLHLVRDLVGQVGRLGARAAASR